MLIEINVIKRFSLIVKHILWNYVRCHKNILYSKSSKFIKYGAQICNNYKKKLKRPFVGLNIYNILKTESKEMNWLQITMLLKS